MATKILAKKKQFFINLVQIYGGDYETVDGTGIRDYIHVMDLVTIPSIFFCFVTGVLCSGRLQPYSHMTEGQSMLRVWPRETFPA